MLDENLPTFLLRPSSDKPKQNSTYFYSQYGSEPEPSYSLRHPDPSHPDSKNRYAAGLYDSFNSEVLFAEVLLIPSWTNPTLSAEQIRQNGGVPPPPEPILPTEFTVQLYNPDQQILVRHKPGTFTSAPAWEFEMPQQSFREPSASTLDRTQHDPAVLENTPKIGFKWKKDSKLSKDLACFLSGKSLNADGSRKKNKEPDITVAIFKALKEITLYEPNLQRVSIEDMKGFEVVLLLGAVVIRDVYFGNMKETFNIGERRLSQSTSPHGLRPTPSPAVRLDSSGPQTPSGRDPRIPPTDPRTQWEIDAETAALRKQAAQEERERKRVEQAEQKQIKKMLEAEDRDKQRRQAEIDKETERLRRLYGQEDANARPPVTSYHSAPSRHSSFEPQAGPPQWYQTHPQGPPSWGVHQNYPYMSGGQQPVQSGFLTPASRQQQQRVKPKHSFFGFKRESEDDSRLQKKRSAVF